MLNDDGDWWLAIQASHHWTWIKYFHVKLIWFPVVKWKSTRIICLTNCFPKLYTCIAIAGHIKWHDWADKTKTKEKISGVHTPIREDLNCCCYSDREYINTAIWQKGVTETRPACLYYIYTLLRRLSVRPSLRCCNKKPLSVLKTLGIKGHIKSSSAMSD